MKKSKDPFFVISIRIALLLLFFIGNETVQAQVKIGENANSIDPASVLELESTSRALVLTRVTDAQMQLISPLQGAVVFNTDQQCVFYFDEGGWKNLCSEVGEPVGDGATLVDNGDDTYTFTDANDVETLISLNSGNGSSLMGQPGSIFFAGADRNATQNTNELFWDDNTNRLGIGANTDLNSKLTVNGDVAATQMLLNNANQELTPLVIRGLGSDQRMISFQDEFLGTTLFNINFRGAGLNIDEINKQHRLFIKILGGLGIETAQPTETLDVAGTLRVRELAPAQTNDNFVTVDADGVFHKSVTNSSSGKKIKSPNNFSGRWTNNHLRRSLKFGKTEAPIFTTENFKDEGNAIYEVKGNTLVVKTSGLYDVRANVSLVGSNISRTRKSATTSARISVNGSAIGAISVAANNGSADKLVLSSIHINELLKLKANDVITIMVSTDAVSNTVYFNDKGTSSFTIIKFK
jgi:hypothetical protein